MPVGTALMELRRRAWALKSPEQALSRAATLGGSDMKKTLTALDLLLLGVGGVIGAGVFVLTGAAAHDHAGPAVVLSYVAASVTSMITALCYTEFAVEVPGAGSAYNYVAMTFGEFMGFLAGCNLALELTISAAAVARGWTSYVSTMFGAGPNALRFTLTSGTTRVSSCIIVEYSSAYTYVLYVYIYIFLVLID